MSRHAQLPPRCPLQKKTMAPQANVPASLPSGKDIKLHSRECGHNRTISQSSILEEQPAWLSDLLSDSDSNSNVTLHRRAASDSLMLFNGLEPLQDLDQLSKTETADSCEREDGLGSSCTYGPNSPRMKKLGFPEKEIVSAFSEHVMQNPLHFVSGVLQSDSFGDACGSACEMNIENRPMKRHPGQRSRARKLEYITELESTVDILQKMGSQLAGSVASLIQQYAALSMENKTLKQHLLRIKQDKFIVDGEYRSLKKEVERLRTGLAVSSNNKKFHNADTIWSMLDMRKLHLN